MLPRYLSPSSRDLLYVKCLCMLPRYLSPVVEICYMLNVCVLSRYSSSRRVIIHFILCSMHLCPRTMTTHAESINSDLQRGPGCNFFPVTSDTTFYR